MAKLVYIVNTSLDGYMEDRDGGIDWGAPDEEYFDSINTVQRGVGTYLYGRHMYEAMVYWETAPVVDQPAWIVDFTNMWRRAEKFVFSKSLAAPLSEKTTVERNFDIETIREMKAVATQDLTVGGTNLAAQAFGARLVDECHMYLWPITLGGGKHSLPRQARLDLDLLNDRCFASGVVHLHYRVVH